MSLSVTQTQSIPQILFRNFTEITKFRLSVSVVFSSVAGYLLGAETVDFYILLLLCVGGYFMVGASNIYNQIIERDLDALMDRTKDRPIPAGRMQVNSAFALAIALTLLVYSSLYYQPNYRYVWRYFNFYVREFVHAFKNQNTTIGFCGSNSRGDSFYVGLGSCYKQFRD